MSIVGHKTKDIKGDTPMAAAINAYITAVIFRCTHKATGRVYYAMPTGKADASCYYVTKEAAGKYACTCPDHQYRKRDCKHILALVDHLKAKAQARVIHQAEQIAAEASAPASPAVKHTKANALPYDDSAPFSIFKPERRYQTLEDERAAADGYAPSDYYQHAYR
jgi:hypothetical protein